MEYTVLLVNKSEELDKRINEMVSDGWKPLGDVSIIKSEEPEASQILCQVMAKDKR